MRAREERSMSIGEVAGILHIRPRYIQALEEGRLESLPGFPYAKGYLKRYVAYLSLDRVEILRRFEMIAEARSGSSFFMPHHFSQEKHIDFRIATVATFGAVLLLIVWMALRPAQSAPSLVDPVPEAPAQHEAAAPKQMAPLPCMNGEDRVYPPCHWQEPETLPTVMQLINP